MRAKVLEVKDGTPEALPGWRIVKVDGQPKEFLLHKNWGPIEAGEEIEFEVDQAEVQSSAERIYFESVRRAAKETGEAAV